MITGECDPNFTPVQQVLSDALERGDDLGAGVTVIVDGVSVVDLRGGYTDRQKTEAFGDALTCVYSCGKAITAAIIMAAVDDGLLDYETTMAAYWPAFAAGDKADITLGDALSHQAGLAAFMEPIEPSLWLDWDGMCAALAAMEPIWRPGDGSGYHPQTYGFLAGEAYRRVSNGMTIGAVLEQSGYDVHCGFGTPASSRVRRMIKPPAAPDLGALDDIKKAAFLSKWSAPAGVQPEDWMAAELPASNMHATSRGAAEIMQAFATGVFLGREISSATRDLATAERCRGHDRVLPFDLSWGAGVMRNVEGVLGPSPTAVGHYGFGGSCVLADPAHRLSFAYVPNKMSPHLVRDPRAIALIEAVYDVL